MQGGGREGFAKAVTTAWTLLLDDAEKLLPPGRHSDLKLQVGRSRRARALAADLAGMEGAPDFGAFALAPAIDSWMMERLGGIIREIKGVEIGPLADLPKLPELQQGIVYYIARSMRYSMVRWKRLSEADARSLFLSSAEAGEHAAPRLPSRARERSGVGWLTRNWRSGTRSTPSTSFSPSSAPRTRWPASERA